MKLRHIFLSILILSSAIPSFAVSDKDMEQAKVIAAKLYLRWTNNGSGYLDEVSASSMSELEGKLKEKEKENLKAFKSVNIPADYASWDKQRFVQFWGTTFFTSPALSADGKRAKDRVKAKVSEIKVSAPSASTPASAPEPIKESTETENPPQEPAAKEQPVAASEAIAIPEPEEVTASPQEAIADSLQMIQAEEDRLAMANRPEKGKSHTWVYVVILIVLVGLVIWLMVYAANMMKGQNKDARQNNSRPAPADPQLKKELKELETENDKLRAHNAKLREEVEALRNDLTNAKAEAKAAEVKASAATSARIPTASAAPAPTKAVDRPQPKIVNEIYLGRANQKGLFVRGDRRPNPDHTIFRLDTKDGIVGTFKFADTPEAFALATSNPLQYIAGGCICENFEDAETADRIITENSGTAILENGCWKVLRKAKIRFE